MSSPKDLEQRVSAIEADVAVVRELGAGADREAADVRAELRGHGRVLTALRETQLEMQVEMRGFRETQVRHYAGHKADAAEMKAGMARIVRMLEDLSGDGRSPGA